MINPALTANAILNRNHWDRQWDVRLQNGEVVLRLCLQPSGRVLLEGRVGEVWFSCYEDDLYRDHCINNQMYRGVDQHWFVMDDIRFVRMICDAIRETYPDYWDARYAPGPDFTGG